MKVKAVEDKKLEIEIRNKLAENGGYCPCKLEKIPDTKCMCLDFRREIADPEFEGYCHCGLYYKEK